MYFWISDTHFGHFKMIEYATRPFKTLVEMDETLIRNINSRVDENDTIFFLGDFCMKKSSEASDSPQNAFTYYRNQIQCRNIIWIEGNHDHNNGTKTIIESVNIDFGGNRIHMTHNPKHAIEDFKFNFYGHIHGKFGKFQKVGKKSVGVDLSVENWEYQPVDINQIMGAYSSWLKSGKHA